MTDVPSYEVTNQHGQSRVLHQNQLPGGDEVMMPQEQNGKADT